MLTTLTIKDFAIISQLELSFDAGMSVLTGETGAGKSIIINALGLLLGGKASADIIRTGADEAAVEGLFTVDRTHAPTMAKLSAIGIDLDDDEFVVRRVIPRKGRGRIYIGGTLQTVSTLKDLMRTVIDISGQHEHVSLLDTNKHLAMIDKFCGIEDEVAAFGEEYAKCSALRREAETLRSTLSDRAKRLDFLNYQIEELAAAAVEPGEADRIDAEMHRLSNAEALQSALDAAVSSLYDDEDSVITRLGEHLNLLRKVSSGETELSNIITQLAESMGEIEDSVRELRRIHVEEASAERLNSLQDRLTIIDKLERKYRIKADDLKTYQQTLEQERDTLVLSDERVASLEKALKQAKTKLLASASVLTEKRRKGAQMLSSQATHGLHLLAMENASVDIRLNSGASFEEIHATGADDAEFMLCPNRGEEARSLAKIASGGELSRVLLAIKRAIVEKDDVACYVFDEVDTGIGGMTASNVALMLKEVSRCHQVLCITHLASIASYADAHYRVSKAVVNDRTQSSIVLLNEKERVEEIARMLGGTSITDKTMAHAAEMLAQARAVSQQPENG